MSPENEALEVADSLPELTPVFDAAEPAVQPEAAPPALTAPLVPARKPATPLFPPKSEGIRKMPDYPTPPAAAAPMGQTLSAPGQSPRRAAVPAMPSAAVRPELDGKRLIVGRDISLSGEINSCDILTVEGRVDASLIGGRVIEVADGGLFKGNAEIDIAEIAGHYEGDLTVREKLTIRATGQIKGRVRYRRLEVDFGGTIIGEVDIIQG
jgi:cytoskeletal protein CcmA (bactofilin family)